MKPVIEVMNVLFDDRFGGPSKRVMLVARATRDRGLSTTLVLPEGRGNAEEIVRQEGLPVIRLPIGKIPRPGHWLQALVWLVRLPFETGRFLGLFRRRKPDVVHVNGAFFLAPGLASRAAGIPLVWHLNDIVIPRSIAPFLGALVSR